MSDITVCCGCKSILMVTDHPMGVPGGQDKEQGYCPLCSEVVAEFMTDGRISVKLSDEQHRLLQTIFNASRAGHPSPPDIVSSASNFIAAGLVKLNGNADLSIPVEVQQALLRNHQPLKTR